MSGVWLVRWSDNRDHLYRRLDEPTTADGWIDADGLAARVQRPVTLAFAAAESFAVGLTGMEEEVWNDRSVLAFELEQSVPVDAEELALAADRDGDAGLVMALDAGRWRPIIDALESRGVQVQRLVPAGPTLAMGIAASRRDNEFRLEWRHDGGVEWVDWSAGHVRRWKWCPSGSQADDLRRLYAFAAPVVVVERGGEAEVLSEIERLPLMDLRRGPLAVADRWRSLGRAPGMLAVAALGLLLLTAAGAWYRAGRFGRQTDAIRQQQAEVMKLSLPNTRRTAAPLRIVRSEYARAQGLRGGGRSMIQPPQSATDTLRRLIAAMPSIRYRLESIAIDQATASIDVRVRRADDVYTLVSSLESAGFVVQAPGADQLDDGSFAAVIEAVWPEVAQEESSGGI